MMDFEKFMIDHFSTDELIDWATMYRNLYLDLGDDVFGQKSDAILKLAQQSKAVNEE